MLSEVTELWGTADIIEAEPRCEDHGYAVYCPMDETGGGAWGLYDRDGALIPAAANRCNGALSGQVERRDIRKSELEYVDGDFVYVGPMLRHYGHFIVSSLARLWAIRERRPGTKLLYHADHDAPLWFYIEHIREVLTALGFAQDDFVRFTRPTLVRQVRVPAPAIEEQGCAHRVFAELGAAVGRHYGLPGQARDGRPVYLSKTRLAIGISRIEHEHEIEQACAARGIGIVHPQELSFPEQLRTLWGARAVSATVGSALHTTLFLPGPSRVVGLAPTNTLISNFAIIDRLRENDARYVHPSTPTFEEAVQDFQSGWSFPDMPVVAADFADLVLNASD